MACGLPGGHLPRLPAGKQPCHPPQVLMSCAPALTPIRSASSTHPRCPVARSYSPPPQIENLPMCLAPLWWGCLGVANQFSTALLVERPAFRHEGGGL